MGWFRATKGWAWGMATSGSIEGNMAFKTHVAVKFKTFRNHHQLRTGNAAAFRPRHFSWREIASELMADVGTDCKSFPAAFTRRRALPLMARQSTRHGTWPIRGIVARRPEAVP